jgi:hypothetical protein
MVGERPPARGEAARHLRAGRAGGWMPDGRQGGRIGRTYDRLRKRWTPDAGPAGSGDKTSAGAAGVAGRDSI